MADDIKTKAQAALNRPVLIVTHNVEFVVTKALPPKEAAAVIKKAEDDTQDAITRAEESDSDDGDRPGLGQTGLGGVGGDDPETVSGDGGDGQDEAPGESESQTDGEGAGDPDEGEG
ncbi:MAG: hypothetical protein KAJ19_29780 [Gammaproteobacteria bacterium]|nr:hypothetical protein [Gammaproteobacteria bacterium]